MAEQAERLGGHELDTLKRRIFVLRSRGMTFRQIAQSVGKSVSLVHHHYKETCRATAQAMGGAGQEELIGEIALFHKDLVQEGLRNITEVEKGSPMRANWISITGKRLDAYQAFLVTTGIMQKAADKVDLTVRDVRKMSDEEIRREVAQLRRDLSVEPHDLLPVGQEEVAD